MPNPGSLGHVAPKGPDALIRRMAAMEKMLNQLMTQRTLESAFIGKGGLTIQGGAITIKDADGNVIEVTDSDGITLTGDFTVNGGIVQSGNYSAGAAGWALRPGGNAEFNDLTLRGGIIGNDALTNPIKSDYYFDQSNGYLLPALAGGGPGTNAVQASVTVPIPAGFTSATIYMATQDTARNGVAYTDGMAACFNVGAPGSDYTWMSSPDTDPGRGTTATCLFIETFTGLSGGDTISIQSRPFTLGGSAWPADSYNSTLLLAFALFFR